MKHKNTSQLEATKPDMSVWVSASAGTGKTKILTDRVLRLLLEQVSPEKILCLTFTNAAAGEMKNRILDSLKKWEKDPKLAESLISRELTEEEYIIAKSLFSRLLLSPEQFAIHTIHSFCQKILQKFPFEAGLKAGFRVLGDMEVKELSSKLIKSLSKELSLNIKYKDSFKYLLKNVHQLSFNDLIYEILSQQIKFRDLFENYKTPDNYKRHLQEGAGISKSSIEYIEELFNYLKPIESEEYNIDIIKEYNESLTKDKSYNWKLDKIIQIFFTQKNSPRKKLLNKKESDQYPNIQDALTKAQQVIVKFYDKIRKSRMIEATIHIYKVSEYVISKYSSYKHKISSLDYDDLIYYTKKLLTDSEMHDWILYKLDGGIAHLLIDEAQDTSPKQWQIIEAIMREFYSGDSCFNENRTIFVVGDEKQSIYSFQGADVSNFSRVNEFITHKMGFAKKKYKNIELEYVYRSCPEILDLVSTIFRDDYLKNIKLRCFRENAKGTIELWPLMKDQKSKTELFWPLISEMEEDKNIEQKLAKKIALYIKSYINSGKIIPSTGSKASPRDFMILIRRRNDFTTEIISALKEENIPVSGIDRIEILNHISVKDIISAAKFALLPEDDLNLASLLHSPLIGIDYKEISKMVKNRENSLYESIENKDILNILESLIQMAQNMTSFDFFHNLIDIMDARKILSESNEPDSEDVLDELLNICNEYSRNFGTSLQAFVNWLEQNELEIKRDTESDSKVRIMTIHASKGLEAPIVIMPDTATIPQIQNNFLWKNEEFLWLGNSKNSNQLYDDFKERKNFDDFKEYLRLLYVAITRAEDHLVICGIEGKSKENCWYNIIENALNILEAERVNDVLYLGEKNDFIPIDPEYENKIEKKKTKKLDQAILKPFIYSKEDLQPNYVRSPLDERMDISYGIILHKILEDAVKAKKSSPDTNHPFLERLPSHLRKSMMIKVQKLFQMQNFKNLLSYKQVQAEVGFGYKEDGAFKFGRIDFLAISDKEAVILDYKTESTPPKTLKEVPELYLNQLTFYAEFIKKAYPNLSVTSKILWLENFSLMEICSI